MGERTYTRVLLSSARGLRLARERGREWPGGGVISRSGWRGWDGGVKGRRGGGGEEAEGLIRPRVGVGGSRPNEGASEEEEGGEE